MAPEEREEIHAYCLHALIDYEIKVVTLNVWGMPYLLGGRRSERFAHIGTEIARLGAQVVCLQEMWDRATQAVLDKSRLRNQLGVEFMHGIPGGSGLCILTDLEVQEWELLESRATRGFERLVRKGALYARLRQPDGRFLDVYNVHLVSSSALMTEHSVEGVRDRQVSELQDWIEQRRKPGVSILVMGDLNISDASPQYQRLQALGDDTFTLCHGEGFRKSAATRGYTFDPTRNPWANSWISSPQRIPERLDYILAQPAAMQRLELASQTIWDVPSANGYFLSDHFGVTTTIRNIRL
jgi:endonuclease/exonuclease/phosphatase family metal-dependent hydrolase